MNWLKRFMTGRYGGDQLSMALLILSILLTFAAQLLRFPLLSIIGYILLIIASYRMLSKNTRRRSMENYKFSILISPVYSWFRKQIRHLSELRTYRFYKCPDCKAKLRLPRGKGKVIITCPKCRKEFQAKS